MSTFSGLVVGIVTAAVLTVFFGEELSHSLRSLWQRELTAVTLRLPPSQQVAAAGEVQQPAAVEATAPAEPTAPAEAAMSVMTAAPVAAAPTPASADEDEKESVLEQRWAQYLAQAATLEPAGDFPWRACFTRAAASYQVPETLLLAIARGESNFDPAARSDKDAVGLMQIRWPGTSRHLGIHREADLYDPCTNVAAGARYLAELSERYDQDLHRVVAAYNYGPGRISRAPVPAGAKWYSHYIYQHLQQVLGQPHVASSELVESRPGSGSGHQVLMSFSQAHRARDFIAYLTSQAPGLELSQRAEKPGLHEVVLLYDSESDRRQALQLLGNTGLVALAPAATNMNSM